MRILNYIGSKLKLIPFIHHVLKDNHILDGHFADLFAGTGIVGLNMMDKFTITSNDVEYYSYIINNALLTCPFSERIENMIEELNNIEINDFNKDIHLISKYYSEWGEDGRLFWSKENALKADAIMLQIKNRQLEQKEEIFLVASLLVSIDKVVNTTSVYGAYLKKLKSTALKPLILEPIHTNTEIIYNNTVSNLDILDVTGDFDVVYLDPPYNNRQYGANYGPLNFIARYDSSIIPYGKTGLIPGYYKSDFSIKSKAYQTMRQLIDQLKTDKIMISYNNEGIINEQDFKSLLCEFGSVKLYMKEYTRYKSNNENQNADKVYEHLYFLDKTKKITITVETIIIE